MAAWLQVMPDDHSDLVPLLPIPNRTVKRICADDSAGSRVKVGHRQALTAQHPQLSKEAGGFVFGEECLLKSDSAFNVLHLVLK